MGLKEIRNYIVSELISRSLEDCYYHGADHSLEVEMACVEISKSEESISAEEIELLRVAALSHDIGHILSKENHEKLGCDFVLGIMPDFGYSEEGLAVVESLILATKFPHKPNSLLEMIICDADLSYLGTDKYTCQSEKLKKELVELNGYNFDDEKDWIEYQVSFLEKHKFFTKYAQEHYNPNKNRIIEELKEKLTLL